MTGALDPYYLYKDYLADGGATEVEQNGRTYRFQFHGPNTGITGNYLEVVRDDGLTHCFGPGHSSELVWRAYHHVERGWEGEPVPAYREANLRDEYDPPDQL